MGMAHLVLADAAAKCLDNLELDESLDQPIDMSIQHACKLGDLLALPILALGLVHEYGICGGELHQAPTSRRLHLEPSPFATKDEGYQAHSTRHVIVSEFHEVAARYLLRSEASKNDLKHPQTQGARCARLDPLVGLHTRKQDIIHLMHVLQEKHKELSRLAPLQVKANLCDSLECNLVDIEGVRCAARDDDVLDVIEDSPQVLEGHRIKLASTGHNGYGLPPLLQVLGFKINSATPGRSDPGQPRECICNIMRCVGKVPHRGQRGRMPAATGNTSGREPPASSSP
mmetsp:Transcript_54540/g.137693  ORF Transcript_54540/g.137693 Transcript_54540/m.137693 type:complete len:286 (+) Transcript_54540:1814-2671(+)